MASTILTFKGLSKSGKVAIYTGLAVAIRIATTAFVNKEPLATMTVESEPLATARQAKPKETKEERKARLAALPKLTAAEKVQRMEEKLAKMKTRLAKAPELTTA